MKERSDKAKHRKARSALTYTLLGMAAACAAPHELESAVTARRDAALAEPGALLFAGGGDHDTALSAAVEASGVPDLARRLAQQRGEALPEAGIRFAVVPCDGERAREPLHRAFVLALLRGVAEASLQTVVDARTVDLTRPTLVDAALRHGCAAVLVQDRAATRPLFERLGFTVPVLEAAATGLERLSLDLAKLPSSEASLVAEVLQRSVVLVRDEAQLLPLEPSRTLRLATLGSEGEAHVLEAELRREGCAFEAASLDAAELVACFGEQTMASTALPQEAALLYTAGRGTAAARALARALSGRSTIDGRLPTKLAAFASGSGTTIGATDNKLMRAEPHVAGFVTDLEARVRRMADEAIQGRIFPGCQIVVTRRDRIVVDLALGHETYDASSPAITKTHRYDLASLTKILASTAIAMRLHGEGRLDLNTPVATLVADFCDATATDFEAKRAITLRMLLTHSSGMAPWKKLWTLASGRDAILLATYDEPLRFAPGTSYAYSDLGLITFGTCLEALCGERLDLLAERLVFEPAGMRHTSYGPLAAHIDVAPTEEAASRGGLIHRRVHDENADALLGIAGHAGLFSTAGDVARFCRLIAAAGVLEGFRLCPRSTVELFCARQTDVFETSRAIGFDTPTSNNSAGSRFSKSSVGHTGFTGTSLWIDRARDLSVVCLTNRVHPHRDEPRIHSFRRALHDLVVDSLQVDPLRQRNK